MIRAEDMSQEPNFEIPGGIFLKTPKGEIGGIMSKVESQAKMVPVVQVAEEDSEDEHRVIQKSSTEVKLHP